MPTSIILPLAVASASPPSSPPSSPPLRYRFEPYDGVNCTRVVDFTRPSRTPSAAAKRAQHSNTSQIADPLLFPPAAVVGIKTPPADCTERRGGPSREDAPAQCVVADRPVLRDLGPKPQHHVPHAATKDGVCMTHLVMEKFRAMLAQSQMASVSVVCLQFEVKKANAALYEAVVDKGPFKRNFHEFLQSLWVFHLFEYDASDADGFVIFRGGSRCSLLSKSESLPRDKAVAAAVRNFLTVDMTSMLERLPVAPVAADFQVRILVEALRGSRPLYAAVSKTKLSEFVQHSVAAKGTSRVTLCGALPAIQSTPAIRAGKSAIDCVTAVSVFQIHLPVPPFT